MSRGNSVQNRKSQHNFAQIPSANIPRSKFDRSFGVKTAFNSGYLVPILLDEVLPGDTANCRLTAFARLSTPLKPLMDNLYLSSFFFFVPLRLIWTNFQKFMGEQANPGDSVSYTIPQVTSPVGGYVVGTLQDYMGLPTAGTNGVGAGNTVTHSALYARAYNLIWNEWFRDENMQNSITVDKGDGPDTYSNYVLKRRGKRPDYFTSALPFAQKGTAVSIPLGASTAPVYGTGKSLGLTDGTDKFGLSYNTAPSVHADLVTGGYNINTGAATGTTHPGSQNLGVSVVPNNGSNVSGIAADLSAVTGATINQLRLSFAVQKMYERDARGGTRYTEIIRSHFGVVSPDARLQRSEYLGGGRTPITINSVAQTSATALTGSTTALGELAAFGSVTAHGHGFTQSFVEHGILIGLASVNADISYQQGLNKMFSRSTRHDHYFPAFATLGEQTILGQEIFCDGSGAGGNDGTVFGYQERWAEYRYKPSQITGQMRSTYSTPLDYWHLSQKFTALPTLGDTFIVDNPPVDRALAVTAAPQILFDGFFKYTWARPMPMFSVPGQIDRF